jgi:hypothetical protein
MAVLLAASGLLAGSARADGDPASDVLATQTLFLPGDAGIPANGQAQIAALLRAAQHDGYQIRVAIVASPADLGSVTELWRQPENYARFLAQELSLVYRGQLLVVMPDGYGVDRLANPPVSEPSALAGARAPGPNLAAATLTAIQRLAAAAGHKLPIPTATAPTASGSSDVLPWIVFALGAALVVIAWTASLRVRPLRSAARR